MNLFKQYGIKEVADVVFYSITKIGDEEFYVPVLVLDTLKISTIDKEDEKVVAKGGYGNKKLLVWNYGKDLSLNLTDALFNPASMSLMWGGKLNGQLTKYTSAIVKANIANKYGVLNYSTKAYPSPLFSDEEWELIFRAAQDAEVPSGADNGHDTEYFISKSTGDEPWVEENRVWLRRRYFLRSWVTEYLDESLAKGEPLSRHPFTEADFNTVKGFTISNLQEEWFQSQTALPEIILAKIFSYIDEIKKLGTIETQIYDTEVVDRMEKCVVKDKYGLTISTAEQKKNLLKYYRNDQTTSYIIYYDAKTMLPLLNITDQGFIDGWDSAENIGIYDKDFNRKTDSDLFTIRQGSVYYKWSRTVKRKSGKEDSILGHTFVIDADTFPSDYKIVGETYIREQKTGKDQRYQFTISRARVSSDTSIALDADGEPTVFNMKIDILNPPNDVIIEFKQIDVDEDFVHGGTRIVPQKSHYSYTPAEIVKLKNTGFTNDEIY